AVMFIVTFVGQIVIIRDISAVLLIGLLVDLMTTWMFNAGILKVYFAKKENPRQGAKQGGKNGRR
ncbi:MAG: preprotein translocase subunit SecF, partial [Methanomicrobium sp.]|nr:preprotein translocase subunit SecF [Methanomicrobium sp.]